MKACYGACSVFMGTRLTGATKARHSKKKSANIANFFEKKPFFILFIVVK